MDQGSRDVPEPFRYSRAHSWPQPAGGTQPPPQPPEPLRPARARLIALVAGAVVLALLIAGLVVRLIAGGDGESVAIPAPTPTPTLLPSVLPEPTERQLPAPGAPPASGTPAPTSPTPSPSRSPEGVRPVTGAVQPYLPVLADVARIAPGGWTVTVERTDSLRAAANPLFSCTGPSSFEPHYARAFRVRKDGKTDKTTFIGARILRYQGGAAARKVDQARSVVGQCPDRTRASRPERWSVLQDTSSDNAEVLIVRRVPRPSVPQGTDHGTDYVLVRNGEVLMLVDHRPGPSGLNQPSIEALARTLATKLCGVPTC